MKRLLFVIACLSLAVSVLADPVTASQARQKASQFLNKRVAKRARAKAPAANALKLMAAGKDNSYYIFNAGDDGGYVVVSGEDATEEILGYSDTGSINPDNMPCGMRMLLDNYTRQIVFLRGRQSRKESKATRVPRQAFHLDPSSLARFGQRAPYNNECPGYWFDDFPTIYNHCPSGCIATAMAQLMYSHKWPQSTTNTISAYKSEKHGYQSDPVEKGTIIDWFNILQRYNDGRIVNEENENAIANLMKYCGASVRMDYDRDESGAREITAAYALKHFFGYSDDLKVIWCSNSSESWTDRMCQELQKGYPVFYFGQNQKGDGHAFMLEGYDEDGFFDINLGHEKAGKPDNENICRLRLFVKDGIESEAIEYNDPMGAIVNVTPRTDGVTPTVPLCITSADSRSEGKSLYWRSTETNRIENVEISWDCYNLMPVDQSLFDVGIVLANRHYEQLGDVIPLGTFNIPFSLISKPLSISFSLNQDMGNDYYYFYLVSKESGTSEWIRCDNYEVNFHDAWSCNGFLAVRSTEKDQSQLTVSNLDFASTGTYRVGIATDVSYTIANNGGDYDGAILTLVKWTDESGVDKYDILNIIDANLKGNSTMSVAFSWVPTNAGEQEIIIINKRWDEVWRQKVNVIPANASLDMLEVTNLTLIDGDLDQGLIDGTILRGTISLKNHDTVTKKSSITICLYDTETQQTKYKPIFVHIEPNNTVTYDFSFSNLIDGHHYEVYGTYASGEEFYRSPQLLCTTAGMGETEPGNEDLVAYEYWFDDDVDGRTSVNLGSNDAVIRASIDTHGLSIGLHRFNFRLKRSDNKYSSVTSSVFMNLRTASEGRIVYWFDDNSDQTCSTPLADKEEEQQVALDLSNSDKFPIGFHTLNMRVATEGKSLSNIYKARVLKTASGDFDRIEYWVDGNFPSQASQRSYITASSSTGKVFDFENKAFNLSHVPSGPHRIYYRAVSSKGTTSSAVGMAPVIVGGGTPAMIEYWFDGDATKSATVPLPPSALQDTVDVALVMSDMEKFPLGFHLLSMRLVSEGREQSPVYSARVLKMASGEANQMEYWVDGDYDNRKVVTGKAASSDANSFIFTDPFDLGDVSAGLHCVYYRATSANGITKSAVSMAPVFVGGGNTMKLEYWFDDENGSGDVQTLSGSADPTDDKVVYFNQTINLNDLSSGVHRLFYRGVNNEGVSKTAVSMTPVLVKSMFGGGDAVLSSFTIGVDNVTVDQGALNGQNEQLFTYTLDATELSLGNHTLKASFMNSYGVRITEQIPFRVIERPPFILGDVNNDMKVTIADAVGVVNYILGNPLQGFNEDAADVNEDGNISISDAVGILNIILNSSTSAP